MKPIEFPEHNVVFAKDQPQYLPLPAYRHPGDPQGETISCWQLSLWERLHLLFTGKLWLRVYTFQNSLQPQLPTVEYPFMKPERKPGGMEKHHGDQDACPECA